MRLQPPSFTMCKTIYLQSKDKRSLSFALTNRLVNLKRADKGNTTVCMDTPDKIKEGNEQIQNEEFYSPLLEPIVSSTTTQVGAIVNSLFKDGHIDTMTHKWLE